MPPKRSRTSAISARARSKSVIDYFVAQSAANLNDAQAARAGPPKACLSSFFFLAKELSVKNTTQKIDRATLIKGGGTAALATLLAGTVQSSADACCSPIELMYTDDPPQVGAA